MKLCESKVSKEETKTILKITGRAADLLNADTLTTAMDVEFVHINTPLDLNGLLEADDENFAHDISGIRRHLNRDTGELRDCFCPRYTLNQ